jgi:hypothetical protein
VDPRIAIKRSKYCEVWVPKSQVVECNSNKYAKEVAFQGISLSLYVSLIGSFLFIRSYVMSTSICMKFHIMASSALPVLILGFTAY